MHEPPLGGPVDEKPRVAGQSDLGIVVRIEDEVDLNGRLPQQPGQHLGNVGAYDEPHDQDLKAGLFEKLVHDVEGPLAVRHLRGEGDGEPRGEAFQVNIVDAEDAFVGKVIRVVGTVERVEKRGEDYVLALARLRGTQRIVEVTFRKEDREELVGLRPGDSVVVMGSVERPGPVVGIETRVGA